MKIQSNSNNMDDVYILGRSVEGNTGLFTQNPSYINIVNPEKRSHFRGI